MSELKYEGFEKTTKKVKEVPEELTKEVNQVRAFVEKILSLSLDSSASRAQRDFPGIGM